MFELAWRARLAAVGILAALGASGAGAPAAGELPLDHPAIRYATGPLTDPVAELRRKILAGTVKLEFDEERGYLRSILAALQVPVESQMLVFSKTSVQGMRIEPRNPRMLFFNDSVVVGWVKGGFIELAAQDPRQGMVFYKVDQRPFAYQARMEDSKRTGQVESPVARRQDCLSCHRTAATLGVPGTLIRSVFPAVDGVPLTQFPSYETDSRTAFGKLWGGWYVTGKAGLPRHMGNAVVTDLAKPDAMVTAETVDLVSVEGKCDMRRLLSPYSDVAALMVFEHQMRMMNLLTRVGWEARIANGAPARETVNELVDFMLFVEEAPLPRRVEGTSGFAEKFASQGPHDHLGRSLRQLDLERRLMRYPCSYMIDAPVFDALPEAAKQAVYARMWRILSGREAGGKYAKLSATDRRAVVEILRDTKPGLPGYFQVR